MAYPKEERNRRFLEDWQVHHLGNERLGEKYGLTVGGVKALKARLRQKERSSPATGQKIASPSPSTSTSIKRMTFWLPEEVIRKVKEKAHSQNKTASAFLREILLEYLKRR
ncbi:hypothetical protein ES702_01916 [subsurface metagenome]